MCVLRDARAFSRLRRFLETYHVSRDACSAYHGAAWVDPCCLVAMRAAGSVGLSAAPRLPHYTCSVLRAACCGSAGGAQQPPHLVSRTFQAARINPRNTEPRRTRNTHHESRPQEAP